MTAVTAPNPSARVSTLLTAALALSIGWGIRGNFGHEYGAMMPGCLAAMAVCILSGREDWRRRVAYFAMFGALGWGFGASISYMQVISYTHSGHLPSQIWGFAGLFLIGFVWAGMGGAGTAFPAVASRDQLTQVFKPLCWVFFFWMIFKYGGEVYIVKLASIQSIAEERQKNPFYWFDTDWLQASIALAAVCLYDLWNRRSQTGKLALVHMAVAAMPVGLVILLAQFIFGNTSRFVAPWAVVLAGLTALAISTLANPNRRPGAQAMAAAIAGIMLVLFIHGVLRLMDKVETPIWLYIVCIAVALILYDCWNGDWANLPGATMFAAAGALIGAVVFWFLGAINLLPRIGHWITYNVADLEPFHRAQAFGPNHPSITELQRDLILRYHGDIDAFRADTFTNWPQIITDNPAVQHSLGWILGTVVALIVYYFLYGKFRNGARMLAYMAAGWLIGFLLLPVLLGVRLTPPRGDDWAGILGVWVATMVYLIRYGLAPVAYASIISGTIGGLAFSGTACMKLLLVRPGNPKIPGTDPATVEAWTHWQHANWHSWLEQTYGFWNGIAIAVAIAAIARKVRPVSNSGADRRWTEVFAVFFVLFALTYFNWFKNVANWIGSDSVQAVMAMPLFHTILYRIPAEFSAEAWFSLVYGIVSFAGLLLLIRHLTRPLPFIPQSYLGKGQLLFLTFLWTVVLYNLDRAIPRFTDQRLLTEAVVIINAALAMLLIVLFSREKDSTAHIPAMTPLVPYTKALGYILVALVIGVAVETMAVRAVYGGNFAGHAGKDGRAQYRFGPDAEWRIDPIPKTGKHS